MNEDIFWFEVSVNQILAMEILKRKDDLRGIKSGNADFKLLTLLNQLVQFSSINIVHN